MPIPWKAMGVVLPVLAAAFRCAQGAAAQEAAPSGTQR